MVEEDTLDWKKMGEPHPVEFIRMFLTEHSEKNREYVRMVTGASPSKRLLFGIYLTDTGFRVVGKINGKLRALVECNNAGENATNPTLRYKNRDVFCRQDLIRLLAVFRLSLKVTL